MDVKQFRQIIREEVRKAMQDELRDILTEAVEIASRPEQPHSHTQPQPGKVVQPEEIEEQRTVKSLSTLLQDTAASMSQDDYRDVLGADSTVTKPDFGVIEESTGAPTSSDVLPVFAARAAEIFAAANEKDRERHGV